MEQITSYIMEHWDELFTIIGIAVSLASAIVKLTPSQKDDAVMAKVVKLLDYLSVVNPKAPREK